MKNLSIDPLTNDLILVKQNLVLTSDTAALAQLCESRLLMIKGDYFLDKTQGIPYVSEVFVKTTDRALVDSFFKNILLETDGVKSIIEYSGEYVGSTRTYKVEFKVDTVSGAVTGSTEVEAS